MQTQCFWLLVLAIGVVARCGNGTTTPDYLDARGILADVTSPAILSPAPSGGGRAPDLKVKLLWATKIPARYYEVELSSDTNYQTPVAGSPFRVTAPTTELEVTLPDAVRYYWRVRTNYNAPGVWSTGFFDAMNSSVYVYCASTETTCIDTGQAGNKSHPFRTISAALAYARTATVSNILVARRGGSSAYNEAVITLPGVNLKGGYTETFAEADRTLDHVLLTRIESSGTVLFALGINTSTLVEGFRLVSTGDTGSIVMISGADNSFVFNNNRLETTASQSGPTYGILVQNSGTTPANGPTISANVILSGSITTNRSSTTAAIRMENSAPNIRRNFLKSGSNIQGIADFLSLAAGLLVVTSNPVVVNNIIVAGQITEAGALSWSIGAYHFSASGGTYSNNTIATLSANGNAYAFAINGGSGKPLLTNNILFNAAGGRILYEWNTADNPVSLHNNAFIGDSGGVHYHNSGGTAISSGNGNLALINSSASTNGGAAATVSGNLTILSNTCTPFATYTADDWRLQQNGCSANEWRDLRYGGRNTSLSDCGAGSASCGSVTNDINAADRTAVNSGSSPLTNAAGYSIGAYEQD